MENSWDETRTMLEEPLLKSTHKKGGLWTLAFILGNDALEKMATFALMANMILYLTEQYHMEMAEASNILFLWSAATNFTPVVWAIIADSYLGRYYTIGFGSVVCVAGMILLWTTTIIPQARPPPCHPSSELCNAATFYQTLFLCSSLGLISIGAGGIRSSSLAFGANQLQKEDSPEGSSVSHSYFSWHFALYTSSVFIAYTCVVYVQDNMGWGVGFAVSAVLMIFGTLLFFLASPFYVEVQNKTDFIGLFQVMVACYRNRRSKSPLDTTNIMYHYTDGPVPRLPSTKLRFLHKACIVEDPTKDINPDGKATDPWSLCTVEQVEDVKALLGVIPIWSTGMIMFVCICQNSFPVLQAASTNRQISPGFTIPAASFPMFSIISCILWVALYDHIFLPLFSKLMGRPIHVKTTTRMGLGISLSFISMIVTAVIESIRRAESQDSVQMSALWLVPQYFLNGFAEASNDIAQQEFYFSEFPSSMLSIASTLDGVGYAVANLLASFIMNIVDFMSREGGRASWISTNINKGRYNYYYLILAGLSFVNIVYFFLCSRAYGPLNAERTMAEKEGEL